MNQHDFEHWLDDAPRRCLLMAVVNVTPDSFSDGGRYLDPSQAIDHAVTLAGQGADILDIGGESTRPGAPEVPADEQIRRIVPVIHGIRQQSDICISVDTTRAAVTTAALDAGADLINDISAGRDDPDLLSCVAQRSAPIVLMHMQGTPRTMQQNPHYDDVVAEVCAFLRDRIKAAIQAGIERRRIVIDPGIGFGKTAAHNLALLRHLRTLADIQLPILIGTSRKRFIGDITHQPDPLKRTWGTAATVAWSIAQGAEIVRVHDVPEMRQVIQMTEAILRG